MLSAWNILTSLIASGHTTTWSIKVSLVIGSTDTRSRKTGMTKSKQLSFAVTTLATTLLIAVEITCSLMTSIGVLLVIPTPPS